MSRTPHPNRAAAKDAAALAEDFAAGELSLGEFGRAVLSRATTASAAAMLEATPAEPRGAFEWWFVASFGDTFDHRAFSIVLGTWRIPPENYQQSELEVRKAFHRAILASREIV